MNVEELNLKNGLFLAFISFYSTANSKLMVCLNFDDYWIQTVDLWCQKQPLCQLRHNHCSRAKRVPKSFLAVLHQEVTRPRARFKPRLTEFWVDGYC